MTSRRLVVAAAIVDSLSAPTRLLGARRSRPENISGRWEFPGGKVDPGETPIEALHRELHEELGIAAELGAEIVGPDRGGWFITDRHIMRVWYAVVTAGDPQPLVEHDQLQWLQPDSLWSVPWLDGDIEIVRRIETRLDAQA